MADNTRINMIVRGANVVTVPIDDTLAIAGQAADAKAVGDALAEKVDTESIMESVRITWNGIESDNQGVILADADDLPVDGNDSVKDVLDAHGESIDDLNETVENAVLVTAQTLTDTQKTQARENIGAAADGGVVLVAEQTLTAAQQAQVRDNIGAISEDDVDDVIRYGAQTLTAAQQEQARANIGAGDTARVVVVNISNLAGLPQTITDARITADMVVVKSVLSNQVAQLCDWIVTPMAGGLTISKVGTQTTTKTGVGYGGTDLVLYMERTGSETVHVSTLKQIPAIPVAGAYYTRNFSTTDENSIFNSSLVSSGTIRVHRSGQNISVRLQDIVTAVSFATGGTYTIATLPENCRVMLMQQGQFICGSNRYGLLTLAAGTGEVSVVVRGEDIPAGTNIGMHMPIFNVARDHDDQDMDGYVYTAPSTT